MKLSKEKPPIYQRCVDKFGVDWEKGVIFTYEDTIHCKFDLGPDKIIHEKTHIDQQKEYGVEKWWDRYLEDEKFRLSQELEAYKNEANFIKNNIKDRNKRFMFLHLIARDLSSSMYGNIITYQEVFKIVSK